MRHEQTFSVLGDSKQKKGEKSTPWVQQGADLGSSELPAAHLTGAKLSGANLKGVDSCQEAQQQGLTEGNAFICLAYENSDDLERRKVVLLIPEIADFFALLTTHKYN